MTNLVRGGNKTEGMDTRAAANIDEIVDSILDWRDCDSDAQMNGAEDDYYMGLPRPHRAAPTATCHRQAAPATTNAAPPRTNARRSINLNSSRQPHEAQA